jgi:hypothetical protein
MDKTTAYEEFFKSFRVALNNVSVYSTEHPLFRKSVDDLRKKTDSLFEFACPIRIGFTSSSLMIDGQYWEKVKLYEELAQLFHSRKIKSLEIKKGVTAQEWDLFLSAVGLSAKNTFKEGGMAFILGKNKINNITVEELDYSQFLKGEGEEYKDIWGYLLNKAVENQNAGEIGELADKFGTIIEKFKLKDFTEKEALKDVLKKFFLFLKDKHKDKFSQCSKDFIKLIIKNKNNLGETNVNKIKEILDTFEADDFADTLWDGLTGDDNFDSTAFGLFAQLMDKTKQETVAASFSAKSAGHPAIKNKTAARKKMKELLSVEFSPVISGIYRKVVASLYEEPESRNDFVFERSTLYDNYRCILLNLLAQENKRVKLDIILKKISDEWDNIINTGNIDYLTQSLIVFNEKNKGISQPGDIFFVLYNKLSCFLENYVLENSDTRQAGLLSEHLAVSSLGVEFYLDKIFKQNRVDSRILRLFFKFFGSDGDLFLKKIREKISDTAFIRKLIGAAKDVNASSAREFFKNIFNLTNDLAKIEILGIMGESEARDADFLFSVLKKESFLLKKAALSAIAKDSKLIEEAMRFMFCYPNKFGLKNRILEENIDIVAALGVREAERYLNDFSKTKSLFKWRLRRKSRKLLERWNAGKD